jgi:translation initiation factor eIF-2B subunit delta
MEGRKTAMVLSATGIPVTFVVDAAAGLALQRATMVLSGADAVTSEGVVNKIGTTMIGLAARAQNRPFYVLSDSTKFLPSTYRLLAEEMRPTEEIWPDAPDKLLVFNRYFETTALELVTSVITEHGLLKAPEVKLHLTNLGISSELCAEL